MSKDKIKHENKTNENVKEYEQESIQEQEVGEIHVFKFKLGMRLKDTITSFEGVVTYRANFITGCDHYGLSPTELDKDGEPKKEHNFDEHRLVVVVADPIKLKETKIPGGPRDLIKREGYGK